ncbi:MAG: hypothetical protein IJY25_00125 [Bacilli bacterium]|nr:hypothetical protein [Bacilli bacterium]
MNYYNPYFYTIPTQVATPKVGLFSRIFGRSGITLGGILNGTQRVLNFANQAIPLVKEVRPMIGNAKTMFKVMNEFKRAEKPKNNTISTNGNNSNNNASNKIQQNEITEQTNESTNEIINSDNGPTFFM